MWSELRSFRGKRIVNWTRSRKKGSTLTLQVVISKIYEIVFLEHFFALFFQTFLTVSTVLKIMNFLLIFHQKWLMIFFVHSNSCKLLWFNILISVSVVLNVCLDLTVFDIDLYHHGGPNYHRVISEFSIKKIRLWN